MNIVAITAGASALFIPLALVYRVLNPTAEKPAEVKRKVGARYAGSLHILIKAHKNNTPAQTQAWLDWHKSEDALDVLQLAEEARQAAALAVEVARLKAERAEWDASFLGRLVNGAQNTLAGAFVLLALSPLILLFCLPILGVCALIGFPTIGLFLLIAWCLSDLQNGVADAVVKKMKQ